MRPPIVLIAAALLLFAAAAPDRAAAQDAPATAAGTVFHDLDENGARGADEPGLPGVAVSNGLEVVQTDAEGRWTLPTRGDEVFFVIKPRGFRVPVSANQVPRYYYLHKPKGSPALRFPGVAPTGPLPASIDLALIAQAEPDAFDVLLFGDTQPRNRREVDFVARDVVAGLDGTKAAFGLVLGDIVFDDLSLLEPLSEVIGALGVPFYYVIGNHDLNYDAPDHERSDETYERLFGPSTYAFTYGPVHFIAFNDVLWSSKARNYSAGLTKRQLAFIEADLALVPADQRVVLLMHIPIGEIANRRDLFALVEDRPHVLALSAHRHFQRHEFLGKKQGWRGKQPLHHLIHATVCGSWWHGAPDEQGIPHATMTCGAPNGHSIVSFDGTGYTIDFRAARRPATDQLSIDAPAEVARAKLGETRVYVNAYAGSPRAKVSMRLGPDAPWTALERRGAWDPTYARTREREEAMKLPRGARVVPKPTRSAHLWTGTLPDAEPGAYRLEVRFEDMFGRTHTAVRPLRVR